MNGPDFISRCDLSRFLGDVVKQRRISNSPLIDPAICALIILAPVSPDPRRPGSGAVHRRTQATVARAAAVLDVPVFVSARSTAGRKTPPQQLGSGKQLPRMFVFEEHSCPWSDKAFVDTLAEADRSILLVAGAWLEHEVLGTALHGLAEGYDACVLVDASAVRSKQAAQPARERLAQAGGTPVVTSQVIHEWMVHATQPAQRVALQAFLSALTAQN